MAAPCIEPEGLWDGPWDQPWGEDPHIQCLDCLLSFLPNGDVWTRGRCTWMARLMWAPARALCDFQDLVEYFVYYEFSPLTAVYMLPEWEEFLGLPDPCFTPNTLKERQVAAFAKWTFDSVPSPSFFSELGKNLGMNDIEIEYIYLGTMLEYGDEMGGEMKGPDWEYTWKIKYKSGPWNQAFECLVNQYKLEHVIIVFEAY